MPRMPSIIPCLHYTSYRLLQREWRKFALFQRAPRNCGKRFVPRTIIKNAFVPARPHRSTLKASTPAQLLSHCRTIPIMARIDA